MLFDPKWEVKSDVDIYALPTLIAWAEKQPASKWYDYWNCLGGCFIGEYLVSFGAYDRQAVERLDRATNWLIDVASPQPHTFGAALSRARALLP